MYTQCITGPFVWSCPPRLIQCRATEGGLLLFITDIPELAIEEPQEKDAPVLQESSNGEQTPNDGHNNMGLKSVLSMGKTQNSSMDSGERPVVTFKENIKPWEQSREHTRNHHQREGGSKERRDFGKGNGAAGKGEQKRDGKRKSEMKKNSHEKAAEAGKQVAFFVFFLTCYQDLFVLGHMNITFFYPMAVYNHRFSLFCNSKAVHTHCLHSFWCLSPKSA